MTYPNKDLSAAAHAWIRWRRVALVTAVLLIIAFILFTARGALYPFIISIVLAELLFPFVVFLEKRLPFVSRWPSMGRIISILIIYSSFLALVALILYITIPPLFHEAQEFMEEIPEMYESAHDSILERWDDMMTRIPTEIRSGIEDAFASGSDVFASAGSEIVQRIISSASNAISLVIGLVIVPFFLFYMLRDREQVIESMLGMVSPRGRGHAAEVLGIVHSVIGSYVRAQLLSAFIVGAMVFVGLLALGIPFAATLGLVAGLFGLIPIIGPFLGAIPGILVTLATDPEKVVWVILVYIGVQLIENNVLSPRIQGNAVRLHPAAIMFVLVVAADIAGLWGVIVGVPLVAAMRDVFVYFHRQWSVSPQQSASNSNEDSSQTLEGHQPTSQ